MCVTCVATGSAYLVPAGVGLKVHATRLRRRRALREAGARVVPLVVDREVHATSVRSRRDVEQQSAPAPASER